MGQLINASGRGEPGPGVLVHISGVGTLEGYLLGLVLAAFCIICCWGLSVPIMFLRENADTYTVSGYMVVSYGNQPCRLTGTEFVYLTKMVDLSSFPVES